MTFSFRLAIATLVAVAAAPIARANTFPPMAPADLQRSCLDMSRAIGTVTATYSYKNWEGILQKDRTISFKPVAGACITDQPRWSMTFEKSSAGSPPYRLVLNFDLKGTSYVHSSPPNTGDCYEKTRDWFIDYYRNAGMIMNVAMVEAMSKSVRDGLCPAVSRSLANAVIKKINGN
jgi:hypothetical protein